MILCVLCAVTDKQETAHFILNGTAVCGDHVGDAGWIEAKGFGRVANEVRESHEES